MEPVPPQPRMREPRRAGVRRRAACWRDLRGPLIGASGRAAPGVRRRTAGQRWRRWPAPRSRPASSAPKAVGRPCSTSRAGSSARSWCAMADIVGASQSLVVLEGVGARAEVGRLEERLRTLAAQEARLRAERVVAEDRVRHMPILAATGDSGGGRRAARPGQLVRDAPRRRGQSARRSSSSGSISSNGRSVATSPARATAASAS